MFSLYEVKVVANNNKNKENKKMKTLKKLPELNQSFEMESGDGIFDTTYTLKCDRNIYIQVTQYQISKSTSMTGLGFTGNYLVHRYNDKLRLETTIGRFNSLNEAMNYAALS